MQTSESIKTISAALAKAQKKMGAAVKEVTNPFFNKKYANLGSVMEVVKDPLNEAGITILQPPFTRDDAHWVQTILLHESGEFLRFELKLELTKKDMQALGSAITYARRYMLQALLAIPTEDDDGNAAVGHPVETKLPVGKRIEASVEAFDAAFRNMLVNEMMKLVHDNSIPGEQIKKILETEFKVKEAKQLSNSQMKLFIEHLKKYEMPVSENYDPNFYK